MNEYVSLQKITTLFEQYQQSQSGIGLNGFGYGNIVDFGLDLTGGTQTLYPFMFVTPINVSYDENITTYTISIIFADRINDDKFNLVDVQSDMSIQAKRFISWIKRGMNQTPNLYDNMEINLPVTGIPFMERFNDYVGGISIDAEVVVFEDINACDYYDFGVSPTPTPSVTATPTPTVTPTLTPTCPITTQYLEVVLQDSTKFKLGLYNDAGFTSPADALCDYVVSGTAYGDLGTIYTGTETILEGQHQKQFDLAPVLLPGEIVTGFTVYNVNTSTCVCPVIVNFTPYITPTPTVTPTNTPTPSITPTLTPTNTPSVTPTLTPTPSPTGDPDASAYILAINNEGGTLSPTQETAIETYFTDLKTEGIYSKLYFLHLFLGGTEGSNGLDALNPGGSYDLAWNGTWTHSVSGSTTIQNNSNYARTGFGVSASSPSTTETDFSMGVMFADRTSAISSFQYQGLGTSSSNYMMIGYDSNTGGGFTNGRITNWWSNPGTEWMPSTPMGSTNGNGMWNSMSRSGATSWYEAAKIQTSPVLSGMDFNYGNTSTFTPSSTEYQLNLFRIEGLNNYTMGGRALLNFAGTYLSPSEMTTFMEKSNTLQQAFNREIFT